MQYPRLVPPKLCTAKVRVVFLGGVDIEGREAVLATYCGRCNLQQKTKQILTADKRLVTLEAVALFDGDIAPYLPQPKGLLCLQELYTIDRENGKPLETEQNEPLMFSAFPRTQYALLCENGKLLETEQNEPLVFDALSIKDAAYRIFRFTKERNPDGTVNYTRLELTR